MPVPFLPTARNTTVGGFAVFMVPACLGDLVSDCGCTTAGRYSLSGEIGGVRYGMSDFVRNTRRSFSPLPFLLRDDQGLIQTISFLHAVRSPQQSHGTPG